MNVKKVFCGIVAALFVFTSSASVLAANINLPDGLLIADENGVHTSETGVYGINLDNLNTGDTVTRTITIQNLDKSEVSLYLRSESMGTTGQVNFLDNIHMKITLDGALLYSGKLRGDGADTNTRAGNGVDFVRGSLDLGEYNVGDQGTLQIEYFMDTAHFGDLMSEKSSAEVKWVFMAVQDEKSAPPKTGVIVQYTLYVVLGLLVVAIPTLLVLTKKRKNSIA